MKYHTPWGRGDMAK